MTAQPRLFTRGLLFALLAGLGALPFSLLFGPRLGYGPTFSAYILLLSIAAPFGYAPNLRLGVLSAALSAVLVLPVLLATPALAAALLTTLLALGLGRSGLCQRRGLPRALAIEFVLAVLALGLAALVRDGTLLGNALSVWVFWLIQSVFGLIAAGAPARDEAPEDAFERARAAAERLMRTQT